MNFTSYNLYTKLIHLDSFDLVLLILKLILILTTISLNSILICIILFKVKKKTYSNFLFLSTTLADLAIGFTSQPFMTVYSIYDYWPFGDASCIYWMITDYSSYSISIFSWLFISIQRYKQIWSQSIVNEDLNTKNSLLIISIWVLSYFFWSLMVLPIVITNEKFSYECEYIFSFLYVILAELVSLIMPILFIMCINIMIYIELRNHIKRSNRSGIKKGIKFSSLSASLKKNARRISFKRSSLNNNELNITTTQYLNVPITKTDNSRCSTSSPVRNQKRKSSIFSLKNYKLTKDRKAYLSLMAINVSLILSWLLFLFTWPLKAYCGSECVSNALYDTSVWIIYSSSCTNSILLITLNTEFNNSFKDLVKNLYWFDKNKR
jgi:hypothetical protein